MSNDHDGHELDSFGLRFPLPYRVGFIIVAGIWGWGVNLHLLYQFRIDVPALIRYPPRSSTNHAPHHVSAYRLAALISVLFCLSLLTFWTFTGGSPERVVAYDWMPVSFLASLCILFLAPVRSFIHGGRSRFIATLKRISVGGLAESKDGKFGDIILADALTSYAKVLADLYVVMSTFLTPKVSATEVPNRSGAIVPIIVAIPSLIRLRQCLIEYFRVRRSPHNAATGWGGQHLANALKYSTAFPVIILAALISRVPADQPNYELNRAWVIASLIQSSFTFYWDVAKDWDLTLFTSARERFSAEYPAGLRWRTVFEPWAYYAVIALDLVLRFTWVFRLGPGLVRLRDREKTVFLLQFVEVFRRWVWIFFRVETEWVRSTSSGLGLDDILLGDYDGKHDDED
ncbi:unnamed protein product [Parascedosporium putredinis]|uniref:EXS domain-containing protein n=1 Tax=Parascedosporium putredinis TaxID=1442378 RepID=A0A9P1H6Y1_9PEZI|nr:unnamed protein product [Parascedosporium putredinis]CAI7998038.1 unnamed protein product [Parascedosporium putredinis]